MANVLLTLGRIPTALDLARGFARAGHRVSIAEPFSRHLASASRFVSRCHRLPAPNVDRAAYLDGLARVISEDRIDLVVPVSEETMHVAFLRHRLADRIPVFTMLPDQILDVHDKARFIETARRIGVAAPETYPAGTDAARDLLLRQDVIVKPILSSSGRGIRRVRRGSIDDLRLTKSPAIVQALIDGPLFSTCALARSGTVVANAIYRGTLMSGSIAVAFERIDEHGEISRWVERFVRGTDWTGFISFDLIEARDGGVYGIECNPRTTSGLHFFDPASIAAAIVSPQDLPAISFRPQARLQHFFPALTEVQTAALRGRGVPGSFRGLFGLRDIAFDWQDPAPFVTMPWTAWPMMRQAIARRMTMGEVSTLDIGWYEANS